MNDQVEVAVTILLIVLLLARELIEACNKERLRTLTRCFRIAIAPLLVTYILALIMRIMEIRG